MTRNLRTGGLESIKAAVDVMALLLSLLGILCKQDTHTHTALWCLVKVRKFEPREVKLCESLVLRCFVKDVKDVKDVKVLSLRHRRDSGLGTGLFYMEGMLQPQLQSAARCCKTDNQSGQSGDPRIWSWLPAHWPPTVLRQLSCLQLYPLLQSPVWSLKQLPAQHQHPFIQMERVQHRRLEAQLACLECPLYYRFPSFADCLFVAVYSYISLYFMFGAELLPNQLVFVEQVLQLRLYRAYLPALAWGQHGALAQSHRWT